MRIYRLEYSDPDLGRMVEWYGSMAESRSRRAAIRRDIATWAKDTVTIQQMDVPTNKSGMLEFLNDHAARDNG